MEQYVLVQLYTNGIPPYPEPRSSAEENLQLRNDVFKTDQLPYYVIVEPAAGSRFDMVKGYPEGLINDVDGFARFLRDNMPPAGQVAERSAR